MTRKTALLTGGLALAGFAAIRARQPHGFSFSGKSVLIMGASRGLGLVMARLLVQEGAHVTITARDPVALAAAKSELWEAGGIVQAWPADIRDRAQVEETVKAVVESYGRIDVLINNAGVMQVGPWNLMTIDDVQDSIATHALGPLYAISAVVPHMKQQGEGRIVNISSIGGRVAVPHMMPYAAGKFALAGISDGLRAELARDGIYVTSVFPGLMRTGSHVNALFKGKHRQEFAWFSLLAGNPLLSTTAERAARKILEATRRGRPELVITVPARAAILGHALFPNIAARIMKIVARVLPRSTGARDAGQSVTGWDSSSRWSPSVLTRLADRVIVPNNEDRAAG